MVRSVVLVVFITACGFEPSGTKAEPPDAAEQTAGASDSFIIEAEAFTSAKLEGGHQWTAATVAPGYSGASYMQCLPLTGSACREAAMATTCGAPLVYSVKLAKPG